MLAHSRLIGLAATAALCLAAAPCVYAADDGHFACSRQSKTLPDLKRAFQSGRLPSESQVTGTWVAIGMFGAAANHGEEQTHINCTGLKRDDGYEVVLFIDGYSVQPFIVGVTATGPRDMQRSGKTDLTFPIDFGGEADAVYRCRLSSKETLICLVDVYDEGVELRKASAERVEGLLPPFFGGSPLHGAEFLLTAEEEDLLLAVGKRVLQGGAWSWPGWSSVKLPRCVFYTDRMLTTLKPPSPWLVKNLREYAPGLVACDQNKPAALDELYLGPVRWRTPSKDADVYYGFIDGLGHRVGYSAHRGFLGHWTLKPLIVD